MSFHFPTLLYKSALLQRRIEAENRRPEPDRLLVMRLNALRLKLMNRLLALTRNGGSQDALVHAC